MPVHKAMIGTVLLLAVTAYAQEAKCPSYHANKPLSRVSVFDGPPAENADLAPDVQKGSGDHLYLSWDISYLSGSGRDTFLVCRYAASGDEPSVTIKLDKKLRTCTFQAHGGGLPAQAECN